jgi:hypothetical protein
VPIAIVRSENRVVLAVERGTVGVMWHDPILDRRRCPRGPSAGMVVVRAAGRSVRGRIVDLSTDGVRARVESMTGLEGLADCSVGIDLRFDATPTEWVSLRGHVVRVSCAFLTIVIAFDHVPAAFAEIVEREGRADTPS